MTSTPPHFSPDGRWYWDGQTWQPAPNPPPSHAGRIALVAVGLAVLLIGGLVAYDFATAGDDAVQRIECVTDPSGPDC